ncbi:uncharacterized protein LOC104902442 [Beta vulgaris subsp. vulgaris]|uniref:uncharacterized protein LOC104902442 n=1 Tax=Beta vulgaris subsp. vulgaris TaxID=3555 RepID=UPI00203690A3|nr:uncharacterized protein LOC104902442 [Beta vulgaris subsp. vulgaris]XP_057247308.1 uncharacterized protein LOC104902442 [Beta vulgaris subsp. vulgaris]XP_057247309.1 uncharacterized protein LOC104902442 [Beta vulgaris subsp. vulgaris]
MVRFVGKLEQSLPWLIIRFVCDNFAKRKMKWFNNCGLSINRALSTSNAIRTTIASYKRKRKGKHYIMVGRLIDIDVDSFTCVSGYMTIFDSTGTMRVKLFTKQIEFILHSTKAKLKHMFDAVHDRVLLRSELLTRVRNAYIFVFHPLHLSAYIVDYVIYVDWAEECAYLFKMRSTLNVRQQ